MADLINVMGHFCSTVLFAFEAIFVHTHLFRKKFEFLGFSICSYLVDVYAKNVVERGRNFKCQRTLPSLLVYISNLLQFYVQPWNQADLYVSILHFHCFVSMLFFSIGTQERSIVSCRIAHLMLDIIIKPNIRVHCRQLSLDHATFPRIPVFPT